MSDPLTVIDGDALSSLKTLEGESVQTCVTSPPYWGLRSYGTDSLVWDNHKGCEHEWIAGPMCPTKNGTQGSTETVKLKPLIESQSLPPAGGFCKCGAWRGELGLEPTPELYVQHLVEIFSEVRRVLRNDATLWLNIGDSYSGSWGNYGGQNRGNGKQREIVIGSKAPQKSYDGLERWKPPTANTSTGLKPKDLVGIPWMVAFALRADGWYLRSDIIWSKPNPMPESVTDRPTKSHEYIFLLSKSERYFYDAEAIKEPGSFNLPWSENSNGGAKAEFIRHDGGSGLGKPARRTDKQRGHGRRHAGFNDRWDAMERERQCSGMRNRRSVWEIATRPFAEAHFATFPPDLVTPCILAGSRLAGKRCDCDEVIETPLGSGESDDPTMETGRAGLNRPRRDGEGIRPITRREQRAYAQQMKTSPHRAQMATEASTAFEHYVRSDKSGARPLPPVLLSAWRGRGWLTEPDPCGCPIGDADTVLDPFAGSGTTGKVAIELGRKAILIEPKAEYIEMIERRCRTTIGLPLAV